jgi:hypothetical protein
VILGEKTLTEDSRHLVEASRTTGTSLNWDDPCRAALELWALRPLMAEKQDPV